jgi:HPt (histidine-containing phosphotransfer) domain-containing protein
MYYSAMNTPQREWQTLDRCFGTLSGKLPQLREAIDSEDPPAIQLVTRDLRGTLSLLGMASLSHLSHEIENCRDALSDDDWREQCERFCVELERCERSLKGILAAC